jgi:hypothetical protein
VNHTVEGILTIDPQGSVETINGSQLTEDGDQPIANGRIANIVLTLLQFARKEPDNTQPEVVIRPLALTRWALHVVQHP